MTSMKKERESKDDGRYIIFYSSKEDEGSGEGSSS